MAARVLGWIPGIGVGTALIVISNLCALVAMAALVVLVRRDLGDRALARRSVWLLALAPSAYSLVLGYADAALLLCVDRRLPGRPDRPVVVGGGGRAGRRAGPPGGHPLVVPVAHRGVAQPAGAAPPVDRWIAGRWPRVARPGGRDGGLPGLGRVAVR